MGRHPLTILGAVAVVVAALAPFLLRFPDPFEESDLRAQLLQLRGLDSELVADALQLRVGVQNNYDTLAQRGAEISRLSARFAEDIGALEGPSSARLLAAFAPFQVACERRADILRAFPIDNAKLSNALLLMGTTFERARKRLLAEAGDGQLLPALQELHRLALAHHGLGDAASRAALECGLATAKELLAEQGGTPRAMLDHARTLLDQKERVDLHILDLTQTRGDEALRETFATLEEEARASAERQAGRRALAAVLSILVVVLICAFGAWTALRQSAALEREIAERVRADEEARKLEAELRQAQKLESVGQLAAGIAHEINTPVQFVSDSVHFVRTAVEELGGLIGSYRVQRQRAEAGSATAEDWTALAAAEEEADLDYQLEQVPRALDRALEGLDRVTVIVRSLKEFAHPEQKEMAPMDVNQAVQCTVTIASSEYRYVADVETELGELPQVICHGGGINQVILNILVNAAQAVGEVVKGSAHRGRIVVRTRRLGEAVEISIADTGAGIPPEIRARIFDPFFTTRPVGKGTGQGLSVARSIVEKHRGKLDFESEVGRGTTFRITLPIAGPAAVRTREAVAA